MAQSLRQRRHKSRILAMQALFQADARGFENINAAELGLFRWVDYPVPQDEQDFARQIIAATLEHRAEIDALISERLVKWELERISPVSRAVLRISVAQMRFLQEAADAVVVIDEALLMAKQYDAAESTAFVNGLLDDIRRGSTRESAISEKTPRLKEKIKIKKKN